MTSGGEGNPTRGTAVEDAYYTGQVVDDLAAQASYPRVVGLLPGRASSKL